jgi:dTDP-4-dehydrorhamnose reductase
VSERIAIFGSSGQLGRALFDAFDDADPIELQRPEIEIEDPRSLSEALARYRPTIAINTTAYHDVAVCEEDPKTAFEINALGVDALAAACAAAGVVFAHISSNYVFGGEATTPYAEDDRAVPINVYGASKLAGEHLLARHAREHYVFRTSALYGIHPSRSKGLTFIERMLREAGEGAPLQAVDNVVFSPSYVDHVAAAIRRIIDHGVYGTYHVTNTGMCSWYELAEEAIRQAGIPATLERTQVDPATQRPRRPLFSALAHRSIEREGIVDLPDWREGVADYLAVRPSHLV